jgi:hypothetical protein
MLTLDRTGDGILSIKASGTLTKADYDRFLPAFEREAGTLRPMRILMDIREFRGWDLEGLWEELKFDYAHHGDPGRIAVVGDPTWQEMATVMAKPVFKAEMRFFHADQADHAREWLTGS